MKESRRSLYSRSSYLGFRCKYGAYYVGYYREYK